MPAVCPTVDPPDRAGDQDQLARSAVDAEGFPAPNDRDEPGVCRVSVVGGRIHRSPQHGPLLGQQVRRQGHDGSSLHGVEVNLYLMFFYQHREK